MWGLPDQAHACVAAHNGDLHISDVDAGLLRVERPRAHLNRQHRTRPINTFRLLGTRHAPSPLAIVRLIAPSQLNSGHLWHAWPPSVGLNQAPSFMRESTALQEDGRF